MLELIVINYVKPLIFTSLGICLFFVIKLLIFAGLNYADPLHHCYISIHTDILNGNKSTIIKAIKNIKLDNEEMYSSLCKKVNNIYESKCFDHDPNTTQLNELNNTGCKIAGTKTLFIYPEEADNETVIKKRAETIKNLLKY